MPEDSPGQVNGNEELAEHRPHAVQAETSSSRQTDLLRRRGEQEALFLNRLRILHEVSNELSRRNSVDDLCRSAISLGRERLGFDRLGLWLLEESESGQIRGTFGTDENGELRDERDRVVPVHAHKWIQQMCSEKPPFLYFESAPVHDHLQQAVGEGSSVLAGIWDAERFIGFLTMDNLLQKAPITTEDCQLLSLYALSIGRLYSLKCAEQALKKSEERYRTIVEKMNDGLVVVDEHFVITFVNDKLCRMVGYSRDELLGRRVEDLQEEHNRRAIKAEFEKRRSGSETPYEIEYMRKDKRRAFAIVSPTPIFDEDGTFRGSISVITDITQRKRTETALRQNEERVRLLAENIPVLVYLCKQKTQQTVLYLNDEAERLTGYSKELFLKGELNLIDLCHPDNKDRVLNEIEQAVDARQPFHTTHLLRHRSGEWRCVDEVGVGVFRDEKLVYIEGFMKDITEKKKAEEKLQNAHRQVLEANEELSQYAHAVSHDLKAPLRAIQNYAEFLYEDLSESITNEQKQYLEGLCRAAREGRMLVDDLLHLCRLDRVARQDRRLDMRTFMQDLLSCLDLPEDAEIVVGDEWPVIEAQEMLVRQIFQNLIENGVKFNRSNPNRVELGWNRQNEEEIEFWIQDNGIGIDPKYNEYIFGVCQRLHTQKEYEGTGMGLAVVKKAVGKLGGTVRCDSVPGHGSIFSICLPKWRRKDGHDKQ